MTWYLPLKCSLFDQRLHMHPSQNNYHKHHLTVCLICSVFMVTSGELYSHMSISNCYLLISSSFLYIFSSFVELFFSLWHYYVASYSMVIRSWALLQRDVLHTLITSIIIICIHAHSWISLLASKKYYFATATSTYLEIPQWKISIFIE